MFNNDGKKLIATVTSISIIVSITMAVICWPVAVIIGVLYACFIAFNLLLNRYCNKLIDRNNKETEEHAKINNNTIRYVTPQIYNMIMHKGGVDLGDKIITKEEVTLL